MIELLRIRIQIVNGTTTVKVLRQKTIRLLGSVEEMQKYRQQLIDKFARRNPGCEIHVLFDHKAKEWMSL